MVIDGLHGLALAPGGFRRSAPTSPTPSPGGPLHRTAASSASGKRTVFLPGCNQGIVRALRAVHSPMPLPGGPLHRIAAFSASGKRTVFLPGCNQGIVRALRAVHSPMPSPGGPLHRIAAFSASGKRTAFLPLYLQAELDGRGQKNSLSHLRQAAVLCGERGIRTPGTETRTAV